MGTKILLRRGQSANLPTLAYGELAYTVDKNQLKIGTPTGNKNVGGGMPFNVITVDLTDDNADYSNIADAIAAASSGTLILVGPGSYTCDGQTLPAGVDLVGQGIGITTLSTTTAQALTVSANCNVSNLTVSSVVSGNDSTPIVVFGQNAVLRNVRGEATDSDETNEANGIQVIQQNVTLVNCEGVVLSSSNTGYGLNAAQIIGTIRVFGGYYDSNDIDADIRQATNGTCIISSPILLNETYTGAVKGTFINGGSGRLVHTNGTNEIYFNSSIGVSTFTPAARIHVDGNANEVQMIVDGHSTQTSDLQQWRNSSGTKLLAVGADGELNFGSPTALTITTGAITATKSYHTVDTEASAATDDLDTINGGTTGDILIITAANSTRTVVAKDGTGNLSLAGDFSMDNADDTLTLIYNGTNWLELSRSNNAT